MCEQHTSKCVTSMIFSLKSEICPLGYMNVIFTFCILITIVNTHTMVPNEDNEIDNMIRGLEIVVTDDEVGYDEKDKYPVDCTRAFTTDKVCTYPAHNIVYSLCAVLHVFCMVCKNLIVNYLIRLKWLGGRIILALSP